MNANPESAESRAEGEIKALTALRGIAAMAVVLQHFSATAQLHCTVTIPSLVPHGYMAVDLFFVLSGFIMAYTYRASFVRKGIRAYGDFLGRRLARIAPLNSAVVLAIVLAGWASASLLGHNLLYDNPNLAGDTVANILMLQGLGIGRTLNGPAWSISVEFAAYFVFPAFLAVFFHRRLAISLLAGLAGAVILAVVAMHHRRLGLNTETTAQNIIRCFTEFGFGLLAFRLLAGGSWARLLAADATAFALMGLCIALMLARTDLPLALVFPFLIAALAANRGRAAAMMASRVPYFLGIVSFSIYLIHNSFRPIALAILQALHPAPVGPAAALAFALAGSLVVIPFAWGTYAMVERPGRVIVRRMLRAASPKPA